MRKYTLTFIVLFSLSLSIQAQHRKILKEKGNLFEGIIKTVIFDDEKGSQLQYLDTGNEFIPISLENEKLSNMKVSIRGNLNGKGVLAPNKIEMLEQLKANLDVPVFSSRTTAVILLNFTNDTSQRISLEQARRIVFTDGYSANAYWQQVSDGRFRLVGSQRENGDVFGYLTLPFTNSDCTYNRAFFDWVPAAAQLAQQNGINLSLYQTAT